MHKNTQFRQWYYKGLASKKELCKKKGITSSFARLYPFWKRGVRENLKGLFRQYFKKRKRFYNRYGATNKTGSKKHTEKPRKRYKFATSIQVMEKLLFN